MLDGGSRVNREVHARFLESRAVRSRPATRLRPRPSVTEKFEFIDAEYAAFRESGHEYVPSIVKMCIWMEVSRSGFYEWRDKPESATAKRRGILALYVRKSFGDSDDTYGYRHWRSVMDRAWPGFDGVSSGSGDVAWLLLR